MHHNRLKKVVESMRSCGISQIIVSSPENIFYLLGVWIDPGERLLALYINDKEDVRLIINNLFENNPAISDVKTVFYDDDTDPIKVLNPLIIPQVILGVDKNWPARFLLALMNLNLKTKVVNSSFLVDELRMIKSNEEIQIMKKSSLIADSVMRDIQAKVNSKFTEQQLAKIIFDAFEKQGVSKLSFDTIVSYGRNAADPHHIPDDTYLKPGESVVIDMGGVYKHYCSDITRTFFYGQPCAETKKIYEIVYEANKAAISIIKPGVELSRIDSAARSVIEQAGYGEFYNHRTGHNIGIEDHEYPSISRTCNLLTQVGMTFSVEPGIYIPGKYGVRIEDIVVVTENGVEVINKYPKEMKVIEV